MKTALKTCLLYIRNAMVAPKYSFKKKRKTKKVMLKKKRKKMTKNQKKCLLISMKKLSWKIASWEKLAK